MNESDSLIDSSDELSDEDVRRELVVVVVVWCWPARMSRSHRDSVSPTLIDPKTLLDVCSTYTIVSLLLVLC